MSKLSKSFSPLLILTLVLTLYIGVSMTACSDNKVSVERRKPEVKIRFFDRANFEGNADIPDLKDGEDALTEWEFGCQTNFEFDIVEENRMSTGFQFVRLRIKNVRIILNSPILVWLPKNPAPDIVAHEKGHQEICMRVYSESDETAKRAAESVVDKNFEGEGPTREEACKRALAAAQASVCAIYHQDVSEYARCISEIYDSLDEAEKNADPRVLVKKSFASYKRVSGTKNKN